MAIPDIPPNNSEATLRPDDEPTVGRGDAHADVYQEGNRETKDDITKSVENIAEKISTFNFS